MDSVQAEERAPALWGMFSLQLGARRCPLVVHCILLLEQIQAKQGSAGPLGFDFAPISATATPGPQVGWLHAAQLDQRPWQPSG